MNRNISLLIVGISILAVACSPVSCGLKVGTKVLRVVGTSVLRGITVANKFSKVTRTARIFSNGRRIAGSGAGKQSIVTPKLQRVKNISQGFVGRAVPQNDEGAVASQIIVDGAEYAVDAIDVAQFPTTSDMNVQKRDYRNY